MPPPSHLEDTPSASRGTLSTASSDDGSNGDSTAPTAPWGCQHYRRKCALLSPCCGHYVGCRFCHDETVLRGELHVEADGDGDHAIEGGEKRQQRKVPCTVYEMDRHAVRMVKCLVCGEEDQPTRHALHDSMAQGAASSATSGAHGTTSSSPSPSSSSSSSTAPTDKATTDAAAASTPPPPPPSPPVAVAEADGVPGSHCRSCGAQFAYYHCALCNFYDDTGPTKYLFHCDQCGICRVGRRSDFIHCSVCNACVPHGHDTTKCLQNVLHSGCPVCLETLFSSTSASIFLKCGHPIHAKCQKQLLKKNICTCPICAKLFIDADVYNEYMHSFVQGTHMSEEYSDTMVSVLCNECNWKGQCVFHVVGHKCKNCGSYNTKRVQT